MAGEEEALRALAAQQQGGVPAPAPPAPGPGQGDGESFEQKVQIALIKLEEAAALNPQVQEQLVQVLPFLESLLGGQPAGGTSPEQVV